MIAGNGNKSVSKIAHSEPGLETRPTTAHRQIAAPRRGASPEQIIPLDEDDSKIVAEKIIDVLSMSFRIPPHEPSIGASIGISLYLGSGDDVDTLLINADEAMYQAKRHGKQVLQVPVTGEGWPGKAI